MHTPPLPKQACDPQKNLPPIPREGGRALTSLPLSVHGVGCAGQIPELGKQGTCTSRSLTLIKDLHGRSLPSSSMSPPLALPVSLEEQTGPCNYSKDRNDAVSGLCLVGTKASGMVSCAGLTPHSPWAAVSDIHPLTPHHVHCTSWTRWLLHSCTRCQHTPVLGTLQKQAARHQEQNGRHDHKLQQQKHGRAQKEKTLASPSLSPRTEKSGKGRVFNMSSGSGKIDIQPSHELVQKP